jgi:hypothetical protein
MGAKISPRVAPAAAGVFAWPCVCRWDVIASCGVLLLILFAYLYFRG